MISVSFLIFYTSAPMHAEHGRHGPLPKRTPRKVHHRYKSCKTRKTIFIALDAIRMVRGFFYIEGTFSILINRLLLFCLTNGFLPVSPCYLHPASPVSDNQTGIAPSQSSLLYFQQTGNIYDTRHAKYYFTHQA